MVQQHIEEEKLVDKTGNQINILYPYRTKSGWSFDDEEVGLEGEPFIAGIPEIIDSIVGEKDSFTVQISHSPIPFPTGILSKVPTPHKDGSLPDGWYKFDGTDMVGWLCPALLKYFKDYPDKIYFKIE